MALGLQTEVTAGDFLPIVKYDARAGRWTRRDRDNVGNVDEVDITNQFRAVFDLENIEVGYMDLTGAQPRWTMQHVSQGLPKKPEGEGWRQGFRLRLKLGKDIGGDVREFASAAKAVIRPIDELHTAFMAAPERQQGKLPIVTMTGTSVVETVAPGGVKQRNYAPKLEIVGWVDRPKDIAAQNAATQPANGAAHAAQASPPSTGATRMESPAPAAAAAPKAAAMAEDFG